MTKYLRISYDEMRFLEEKAKEFDMVFKTPNDVLRFILVLGEKPKKTRGKTNLISGEGSSSPEIYLSGNLISRNSIDSEHRHVKIRVDDEVVEKISISAQEFNMVSKSLNHLLERCIQKNEDEFSKLDEVRITRTRPGTCKQTKKNN